MSRAADHIKSLEQTKAGLRVKSTKSEKPRTIGLDDFALQVLAAHREQQKQDKINFGSDYSDNGLIFCQPNGDFYSPITWARERKQSCGRPVIPTSLCIPCGTRTPRFCLAAGRLSRS